MISFLVKLSEELKTPYISDQNIKKYDSINKTKSDEFTQKTLSYIDRGISFFDSKTL